MKITLPTQQAKTIIANAIFSILDAENLVMPDGIEVTITDDPPAQPVRQDSANQAFHNAVAAMGQPVHDDGYEYSDKPFEDLKETDEWFYPTSLEEGWRTVRAVNSMIDFHNFPWPPDTKFRRLKKPVESEKVDDTQVRAVLFTKKADGTFKWGSEHQRLSLALALQDPVVHAEIVTLLQGFRAEGHINGLMDETQTKVWLVAYMKEGNKQ